MKVTSFMHYYALHRPSTSASGKPEIWLAESPNLLCCGNHRHLARQRDNRWENGRIGGSAVPFLYVEIPLPDVLETLTG